MSTLTTTRPDSASVAPWALLSLCLSMLMSSLDTSIANAGLPTLAGAFGASFQAVQWVVLAYLLAITTLIVSAGRLGDLVGRRRLLLAGLTLFTAASAACGLAPSLGVLVAARAVQGLGAAVMMALTVALAGEAVPRARLGSAMGLLGTMSALGTTLGPSLGGLLTAGLGWRMIFLINVPLGLLNLVLARQGLPADGPRARRPALDLPGTALLAATLAAYALAMTAGRGHFGPLNLTLLAGAVAGAGLFVLSQATSRAPLTPPALLRTPGLSAGLAMSLLVSAVVMSTLVVGPFYLARGLQLPAAAAGLALSVGPLVAALGGVPAGRLVDRYGTRGMTLLGLAGMAGGAAGLALLPGSLGLIGYLVPVALLTSGYALFQASNNTAVMAAAGADQRGVVSGLLSLSRNLGLITGASAMGAVFAVASSAPDPAAASPQAATTGMRATFAVAAFMIALAIAVAIASPGRRRHDEQPAR